MRIAVWIVPLTAALVSGCAHTAEFAETPTQFCNVPRTYLEVEAHDDPVRERSFAGEQSFAQSLKDAYQHQPTVPFVEGRGEQPVSPSMLFLSGGSEHGAFGGGFVHEWAAERPSGLPRFKVVTGISTGAIYATHAFLNRTDTIVKNERIFHEKEILKRYVGNGGMKTISGGLTTFRKGAVGDLIPMRDRFLGELPDEVVRSVAREARAGRKLYIAAVDIDLGKATIFDMTKFAQDYDDKVSRDDIVQQDHLRTCYANVIMASSSVPVAAPPTFIDNRMYIDGGARYGLITDEVGKAADQLGNWFVANAPSTELVEAPKPNIYLLINGTLDVKMTCGKLKKPGVPDALVCPKGTPVTSTVGQHEKWDILSLVGRSVDILIKQVYRFSNDRIWLSASPRGFVPHMQRMLPDMDEHEWAIPAFKPATQETHKCDAWSDIDDAAEQPVEFHPRYMHCLVEYGAERARKSKWACFDPLPSSVPLPDRREWDARCNNVSPTFVDTPLLKMQ